MLSSIRTKIIALAILLVALAAFVTDRIYFHNAQDILIDGEIAVLEEEARLLLAPMRRTINAVKIDVRKIVVEPSLLAAVEEPNAENIENLAEDFRQMLLTKPNYMQIRFLDMRGQEVVRMDRRGQIITRIQGDKLQNKGDETYFIETAEQEPGTVYFSDIEPNKENGKIIRPIVLTLRGMTPIYNKNEELAGIVTINLNMSRLISELREELSEKRKLYVTNTEGEYLAHPDRQKLMGVSPKKFTIQDEFPKSLEVIEGDRRKLLTETADGKIISYLSLPFDPLNPERLIGIGLTAKRDVLLADIHNLQTQNALSALFLVFVSAIVAAIFGRMISGPVVRIAELAQSLPEQTDISDLPTHRNDEIGILAQSLERLVMHVQEEDWLNKGQLKIAEVARGDLSTDNTAYNILKGICLYLDVPLAAIYRCDTEENLICMAGYALKGQPQSFPKIDAGSSILSEALADGLIRVNNDLPPEYFTLHSGLGECQPRYQMLVPIQIERIKIGVIELASLRPFSQREQLLMERASEAIGLVIIASESREDSELMLIESQAQHEELITSNEELERQSAELAAQQDALKTQATEMESQNRILEEQKLESEELASALQQKMSEVKKVSGYKTEFLANMSHELRTPLNSLLILAKSFQDNEDGNLTAEQVEEATMIYNGGVELLSLINDVLDFSKIEAGQVNIVKDTMSVKAIGEKLIRQMMPIAKDKNITLELEIAPNVPECFDTDAQRLEQILKNLLSNAIKFTEKGSVTLSIACKAEDNISFSVIDTGIGISEAKQAEIFEAFKQADGSIDRKYGGTGLGLSISQQLADLLGGYIDLRSKLGKGSTFALHLKITEGEATYKDDGDFDFLSMAGLQDPGIQKITSAHHDTDKTILIIEDDENFAKTLSKMLEKQGYQTLVASHGKDGLMMVQAFMPQAVILDLMLPDIDGYQVLQQIKGNIKTRHIPVHILSAHQDLGSDVLKLGAVDYLVKPVTAEQVDAMLSQAANLNQNSVKEVLVVEDDAKTQKAIQKLLQNKNVNITFFDKGQESIDVLKAQHFDCVILDLQLPDMTGFEWLEHIDAQNIDAPPVIVYTARKLSKSEIRTLEEYTGTIIIKGAQSPERLLDEVMLFLHSVEDDMNDEQRQIILNQNNPNQSLKNRKILLVDDDMRNVFAISKMLKKQDIEIVIADDGQAALDKLEEHPDISLIVMDIMMPVMDGYEAIQHIRQDPDYRDIPIIALTARTMPDEKQKCLDVGANDYLSKPVDIEVLLTLMRVLLLEPSLLRSESVA